jgi:hypothetical protein
VIAYKVTNDQHQVDAYKVKLSVPAVEAISISNYFQEDGSYLNNQITATSYQSNAPPGLWESIPLYRLHSSFIYYG